MIMNSEIFELDCWIADRAIEVRKQLDDAHRVISRKDEKLSFMEELNKNLKNQVFFLKEKLKCVNIDFLIESDCNG